MSKAKPKGQHARDNYRTFGVRIEKELYSEINQLAISLGLTVTDCRKRLFAEGLTLLRGYANAQTTIAHEEISGNFEMPSETLAGDKGAKPKRKASTKAGALPVNEVKNAIVENERNADWIPTSLKPKKVVAEWVDENAAALSVLPELQTKKLKKGKGVNHVSA
jgi:hypothetical protein